MSWLLNKRFCIVIQGTDVGRASPGGDRKQCRARAAQMLGSGGEAGDTVCLSRREATGGPERIVPADVDFRMLPPTCTGV